MSDEDKISPASRSVDSAYDGGVYNKALDNGKHRTIVSIKLEEKDKKITRDLRCQNFFSRSLKLVFATIIALISYYENKKRRKVIYIY